MEKVKVMDLSIHKIGGNWCNRFIYLGLLIIGIYFLSMDISLYFHIQGRKVGENIVKKTEHHFTAFSDLTIKLIMSDPGNNYIYVPSSELFDEVTNFSSVFPFITANVISILHTFVSLVAAKFVSLDSLCMRRIGVGLFEFRTWLDALDGVVHRAHTKQKHNFASKRFSFGYYIDAVADIVGSTALCFAILFYLRRNMPKRFLELLPWRSPLASPDNGVQGVAPTKRSVLIKCIIFGVLLLVSSGTWDSYVESYHDLLETPNASTEQKVLQLSILQSTVTWVIMWSWRLLNAHSFLEMVLVAIFVDKIWEFLNLVQYVGYILLIILVLATQIHLQCIASMMTQFAETTTTT